MPLNLFAADAGQPHCGNGSPRDRWRESLHPGRAAGGVRRWAGTCTCSLASPVPSQDQKGCEDVCRQTAGLICEQASTCLGYLATPEAAPASTYHTATIAQQFAKLWRFSGPGLLPKLRAAALRAPLPALTCAMALVVVLLKMSC